VSANAKKKAFFRNGLEATNPLDLHAHRLQTLIALCVLHAGLVPAGVNAASVLLMSISRLCCTSPFPLKALCNLCTRYFAVIQVPPQCFFSWGVCLIYVMVKNSCNSDRLTVTKGDDV
jgi:hypothetical protein